MSRSRKKVPGFSDSEGKKKIKVVYLRIMNRRIRRLDVSEEDNWIPNGNGYRRFIDRWDFRDYNFRFFSERELEDSWYEKDEWYRVQRK